MIDATAPAETIPAVLTTAVREAAADFFESSCGLKFVEEDGAGGGGACAGMMSTISFCGDHSWSFSLVLPEASAVALAKVFAGFDIPLDSPDMADVIGEVVNVIAGGICARLDGTGIKAQMSLPTVIRGDHVSLLVPSGALTKRVGFSGPNGVCWFDLVKARTHRPLVRHA